MKNLFIAFIFILLLTNDVFANDFFARKLKIPTKINRIVSLSPATTEILYELGLDNKIVGVTNDCNYPLKALLKPKTGKFGFINLEKVISLKPDIIIATSDMNKQLDLLKKYNVPVIALKSTNLKSIYENIKYLGKITDSNIKAQDIINKMEIQLLDIKDKAKKNEKAVKPSVFYCVWHDPLITTGNKSFINDIITLAGAKNITADINNSFIKYSPETLIAKNPDYIFIPNNTYKKMNLKKLPWNQLKAVKSRRICVVNDDIFLRPSPRIIYAIREVQEIIIK
ncbi:MAG: helical backbone metal receptor [Candidatus Sericytochromatia bacterium]